MKGNAMKSVLKYLASAGLLVLPVLAPAQAHTTIQATNLMA